MRRDKRSFTLLEIMIVIALIGMTLGVISIQAPKALRTETFERGIDQVKTKIALAQELMLNYQTDVVLKLTPGEKGLFCHMETGKPLSEKMMRNVNRHELIKGIDEVAFDETFTDALELFFDGTLGATPKGKLLLKGGSREAILTLKGFPSHLLRGDHVTEDSEATYPQAVLSFI